MLSFADASLSTVVDTCLAAKDEAVLLSEVEVIYDTLFGFDPIVDDQRRTALHILAEHTEFTFWEAILNGFVYVNAQDSTLRTPLHIALSAHHHVAVKALIANGASPIIEDELGRNAIQLACRENDPQSLELLLSEFSARRYAVENPVRILRYCVDDGKRLEAFSLIVRKCLRDHLNEPDEEGTAMIHYIIQHMGQDGVDFLRIILNAGADVNLKIKIDKEDKTPIELTQIKDVLEVLLSFNATVNKKTSSNMVNVLLQDDKDWAQKGHCYTMSELHKAAKEQKLEYIRTYAGRVVDVVDAARETPLTMVVHERETVSALLARGADPSFFTGSTTAYHRAAKLGNTDILDMFLAKAPPKFEQLDEEKRTVLTCAVLSGNPQAVQRMIGGPRPFDPTTVAAIHRILLGPDASDMRSEDVLKVLIAGGFPVDQPVEGGTPLIVEALHRELFLCVQVLLGASGALANVDLQELTVDAIVRETRRDVVEALVRAGATPATYTYQNQPLIFATVRHKGGDIRQLLLSSAGELEKDGTGNTLLHEAALVGSVEALDDVLKAGKIPVDERNNGGDAPIHLLLQRPAFPQLKEALGLLINAGAVLDAENARQQNVLHVCAEANNEAALKLPFDGVLAEDVVARLIDAEDLVQARPIDIASKKPKPTAAAVLATKKHLAIFDEPLTLDAVTQHLKRGFSPNVVNSAGTPLLVYAIGQYETDPAKTLEIATALLDAHADPSAFDPVSNLYPIHLGIRAQAVDLTRLIVERGANFIVEPIIHSFADEHPNDDVFNLIKYPERRASAIMELLETQQNAAQTLAMISVPKFTTRFTDDHPRIIEYMDQVKVMARLLRQFVERMRIIFEKLRPATEVGSFLIYFADGFLPLLDMAATYEVAMADLRTSYPTVLNEHSGFQNLTFDDASIVPTQQFTRYPDLIKAVMKVTPAEHPDTAILQRALYKYSYIGRTSNDKKMIAESQRELRTIKLQTNIRAESTDVTLDDILYFHGQFELTKWTPPIIERDRREIATSLDWGLKTMEVQIGQQQLRYYEPFAKSMMSFLKKAKISVYLFRHTILFGCQSRDRFKLKFSCKASDVLWDFSREYGMESLMLFTPFGSLLLKCSPPKGTLPNFERNRWRSDSDKLNIIEEADEESVGGFEICYASFVAEATQCVHSKLFYILCQTKTEAKEKILAELEAQGVKVVKKQAPLISYDFQTLKKSEGQESDVLSDILD
jgi:ankyrin repeat protein